MAGRKRVDMGGRIGAGEDATVTPIARGREAFSAPAAPAAAAAAGMPAEIAVDLIDPSPDNPRSDLGELSELAESIHENGLLQPVTLRPKGERYEVIYGHRRFAAVQLAGLRTIPAFFDVDADAAKDLTRRVVENLHREDLSALDEARAYQQLLALGVNGGQRGLAKTVGKSQSHVSKRLGLLRLPEKVRAQVDSGGISVSDAVELVQLADDPKRVEKAVKDAATSYGSVASAVARQLREADEQKALEAAAAEAKAAGLKVVAERRSDRQKGPYPVAWLGVDEAAHAKLDCHALSQPRQGARLTAVCLDPQSHVKKESAASARHRAEAEAQHAADEAAGAAGEAARREFAIGLVRKGTPDVGAGVLMAQLLAERWYGVQLETVAVAELLGLSVGEDEAVAAIAAYVAGGTRKAQRAAYAAGLAIGEAGLGSSEVGADGCAAYLGHLVAAGYELSEFEQREFAEYRAELEVDEDLPAGGGAEGQA